MTFKPEAPLKLLSLVPELPGVLQAEPANLERQWAHWMGHYETCIRGAKLAIRNLEHLSAAMHPGDIADGHVNDGDDVA
jgi:hypothetical protein